MTDRVGQPAASDSQGYVLANAAPSTHERFSSLSSVFDPGSTRHLSEIGVGPGWHCLEVGAGGGSIALWLAARVGPSGHVLATDIDTRFLDALAAPALEIRRHDIATDPLPEGSFDLVHARLVLLHLRQRDKALQRMAGALKPGGWLMVEDFDALTVKADPAVDPAEAPLRAREIMYEVMMDRGVDLLYGRQLPSRFQALGLAEIGTEGRIFRWAGGSAGASGTRANLEQLREPILATRKITEQEFEQDLARLDDPNIAYLSPTLWATWGRRPAAS